MKKETREKKFKCPFNETLDIIKENNGNFTMTCYYFGCIHQIDDNCPIIRQAKGET